MAVSLLPDAGNSKGHRVVAHCVAQWLLPTSLGKRRDVSYQALADLLKAMGIEEAAENIANKISRGKFTAVFLVECLEAVGRKLIRLENE